MRNEAFLKIRAGLADPRAALEYLRQGSKGPRRLALGRITNLSFQNIDRYFRDIEQNHDFNNHIQKCLASAGRHLGGVDLISGVTLYVLCRAMWPLTVLETGVGSGISSAFILRALKDNDNGILYSIDLPDYEKVLVDERPDYYLGDTLSSTLPEGKQSGWIIPNELRRRWRLTIGKSSQVLIYLLKQVHHVDVFLHDSEHTYENMTYEYQTVWPYLKDGGLLISHDIGWNNAFHDFAERVKRKPFETYVGLGVIKKLRSS